MKQRAYFIEIDTRYGPNDRKWIMDILWSQKIEIFLCYCRNRTEPCVPFIAGEKSRTTHQLEPLANIGNQIGEGTRYFKIKLTGDSSCILANCIDWRDRRRHESKSKPNLMIDIYNQNSDSKNCLSPSHMKISNTHLYPPTKLGFLTARNKRLSLFINLLNRRSLNYSLPPPLSLSAVKLVKSHVFLQNHFLFPGKLTFFRENRCAG